MLDNRLIGAFFVEKPLFKLYTTRRAKSFLKSTDIVLIVLWILASLTDKKYLTVVICFSAFLVNDLYGFISWQKIKKEQRLNDRAINKNIL